MSGSGDETVRVWDASSGDAIHTLQGHTDWVTSVVFSPGGNRIVSGQYDKTLCVWHAQTGECLEVTAGNSDVGATAVDGEIRPFCSLKHDGETVIRDAATGTPAAWFPTALDNISTHPFESVWAGGIDSYLCLIRLEDGQKT